MARWAVEYAGLADRVTVLTQRGRGVGEAKAFVESIKVGAGTDVLFSITPRRGICRFEVVRRRGRGETDDGDRRQRRVSGRTGIQSRGHGGEAVRDATDRCDV